MLNSFVQGYVRDAVAAFYGHYPKENEYMRKGRELHEKHGYTNDRKFSVTFELDSDYVELVGIPDYIDDKRKIIKEAKFLFNYGGYIDKKKREGAEIQVLAYLYMLDWYMGTVDFWDAKTEKLVYRKHVFRDDSKLLKVIRNFIKTIKSQQRIESYLFKSHSKDRQEVLEDGSQRARL